MLNSEKNISVVLGVIQSIVALSAIPAGLLMIIQPDGTKLGIPMEILDASPFSDFLIPGLFLFLVNGLAQGFAAFYSFKKYSFYKIIGLIFGIVLILWIIIQVYFIHPIHFLQVIYFTIGVVEIVLSLFLIYRWKT